LKIFRPKSAAGGSRVARFYLDQFTQITAKYTKWSWNISNGHEIYQMAVK
jgi:hypothetical protein